MEIYVLVFVQSIKI